MLNQDTKRKIDSARDILVGKVPDPKAQVEQITTALIYKFMDDMDKDSQEIGGKVRFFTNGFEKYAWTKLMDPKLGGNERLNLYVEAITQLSLNPHIPQLFRDIFKDAFLPYRSPETLGLFLKEINGFTYGDSENLGDAFEYLLSILGSQGEAGQFRTPRHIIDFIVAAIDPKKDDTICDPACGTAGFLISAYKHILKQHDGKNDPEGKEKSLTPDEKKQLMNHFVGYDISPDMVRLSKVNLYLHGFPNPTIYEYDTLSSEEKWDESFDVMLANPPFMTPRGGIRPHRRFGVQANRSEVLFMDYILEHLRPNGRAGIIVPEGIIFQSANAYKTLRKLLIEDGLLAVVSLPAGVFNPYAGVKTSILIFDKALAKRTKHILFIKIQSDGLDLGAQRRPVVTNDLPLALEALTGYRKFLASGGIPDESGWPGIAEVDTNPLCQFVSKEEISKIGDYNLSGDRYKEAVNFANQKSPMLELGKICTFEYGKPLKEEDRKGGEYPVFGSNGIVGYHNAYLVKGPFIIVGRKGTAGAVTYSEKSGFPIDTTFYVELLDENKTNLIFLYFLLRTLKLGKLNTQSGVPGLNRNDAYKVKIPLPPIEVQKEIVGQIEKYQKIIDGAWAVAKNWKPSFVVDPKWLIEKLGKISERVTKGTTPTTAGFSFQETGINFVKIEAIDDAGYFIKNKFAHINEECNKAFKRSQLKSGDVLFSIAGALGRVALVQDDILPANTNQALAIITPKDVLDSKYLEQILRSNLIFDKIDGLKVGVAQYNISLTQVSDFDIPLPSLEIQKQIVEKIEAERTFVEGNKKLIGIMEQKIADVLSGI